LSSDDVPLILNTHLQPIVDLSFSKDVGFQILFLSCAFNSSWIALIHFSASGHFRSKDCFPVFGSFSSIKLA